MFNPFKLYAKFYMAQIHWIRRNRTKYIVLNVVLGVVYAGYLWIQDHKEQQEREKKFAQEHHHMQ